MVKKHWPDAIIIGCFFHFKQAIRKYLIKLGFPEALVTKIVKPKGLIDLVFVLPLEDIRTIDSTGWFFIASKIDENTGDEDIDNFIQSDYGKTKLAEFYIFIRDTWLHKDIITLWSWNAAHVMAFGEQPQIVPKFRTNCVTVSYNNFFNGKQGVHPPLMQFIDKLTTETSRLVEKVSLLQSDDEDPIDYAEIQFLDIPHDYSDFEAPSTEVIRLTTKPCELLRRKSTRKRTTKKR